MLLVGILALIIYGVMRRDPAAFVILTALVIFVLPVVILFMVSRRAPHSSSDEREPTDVPDNHQW